MSLPLPGTLTPTKVSAFRDCALAFRFSVIERLPDPPGVAAVRGSLVHRALQDLFWRYPAGERTPAVARDALERAWADFTTDIEFTALALPLAEVEAFRLEAAELVDRYFLLEDPNQVRTIGVELQLEAALGDLRLRGVIDRLDLDDDGELVITDYKTGRAPTVAYERRRLDGVHFYAYLCEQMLGRRPARVQLLYLSDPVAISTVPSDGSVAHLQRQAEAIWSAIQLACAEEDFQPRPSGHCAICPFHAYCPALGGDLSLLPPRLDVNSVPAAVSVGAPAV